MRYKILFLGIIKCLFFSSLTFALSVNGSKQDSLKEKISITRDEVNNRITFYLKQDNAIKDSLTLYNLNFKIDSLVKVNDNLWHYMYSVRCGSNCKLRNQIILMVDSSKLRIPYVGLFSSSFDYSELYSRDPSIKGSDVLPYTNYNCVYTFSNDFFSTKPIIKEYLYKGNVPDDGKGATVSYQLKYDNSKKIYYTQTQLLSGEFTIIAPQINKQFKKKINRVVPVLKFSDAMWVYYNNTWYELNPKRNNLVKFE